MIALQSKRLAYVLDNRLRIRVYDLGEHSLSQRGNIKSLPLQTAKGESVNGRLIASED